MTTANPRAQRHPLHLPAGELLDLAVTEVADVEARAAGRRRYVRLGGRGAAARSAIATFSRALRIGTRP